MKKLVFVALIIAVIGGVIAMRKIDSHKLKGSFAILAAVGISKMRRWAKIDLDRKPDLNTEELPSRS